MQARVLFANQMPNRGEGGLGITIGPLLPMALCWRTTLALVRYTQCARQWACPLSLRQPDRGACLEEALL